MRLIAAAFTLCLAATAHSASVAIVERANIDKSDWKYSVGWDGVTLPSDVFGDILPVNDTTSSSHLERRTAGGVYICTDIYWGGHCGYAVQPLGVCIVLGSEWADKISSFGPDKCTTCLAWRNKSCDGFEEWAFTYPGDGTGGLGPYVTDPFNDAIASFKCIPDGC